MKIALINVRYSPNLGDGLLSECLEAELRSHLPDASFVTVDLAGRTSYAPGSTWRRPLMKALLLAPEPLRKIIARQALDLLMKRLAPGFAQTLSTCDAAVIGGGNLLADADLNFPLKVSHAARATRQADGAGMPLAIYGVGASKNWSGEGSNLFREVLSMPSIVWLTVRDELSRDALLAQASDALRDRSIDLVRDPGLLASRHFPLDAPRTDGLVGLCLTDPLALRYHGGEGDARSIAQWFGDLIKALTAQGREVLLFTNGSPEDRHFLARHAAQWQAIDTARVHVAPPPDEPAALVRTIAGCSLVIAHRMHACIAAHSFGIPTIGLRWDAKLDAFFCLAGRSNYLHTAGITPVAEVAASAGQAVAEGVDRQACDSLIAEAAGDVSTLARTLREAAK